MPPQRPDLILSSHIPNIKFDILIGDRLDVESDCRNSSDILVKLQFVENGRLAGGVEAQHQQAHFLRAEDLAHHFRDLAAHCGGFAESFFKSRYWEVFGRGRKGEEAQGAACSVDSAQM